VPGREGTSRLLRKFKDTPVKPAGAVEIIDKMRTALSDLRIVPIVAFLLTLSHSAAI
jgi:hypothetical protein